MEVKTFRAKNMQEALQRVREELGPLAAILQTREVRTSRFFGLLRGETQVEVQASPDVNVPQRFSSPTPARPGISHSFSLENASASQESLLPKKTFPETFPVESAGGMPGGIFGRNQGGIFGEIQGGKRENAPWQTPTMDLSALWNPRGDAPGLTHFGADRFSFHKTPGIAGETRSAAADTFSPRMKDVFLRIYADLIEADLDDLVAHGLLDRLRKSAAALGISESSSSATRTADVDAALLRNKLTEIVEADLRVSGPIQVTENRCRLVALVGPTGVGKTTTIAKLAAHYKLRKNCRVGLITLDTFRVAAVEQLKIYSDIINVPMHVVSSPREIHEAVRRMTDFDLVLMDTTGRSQGDDMRIHELRSYLQEAGADEVHLVLSSTARPRVLQQTAERFSVVGTTSLIITKLDEAAGLGNILPLLQSAQLPVSYVTNGQNVPEDIEIASVPRLARWILGQDAITAAENSTRRDLQMQHDAWA